MSVSNSGVMWSVSVYISLSVPSKDVSSCDGSWFLVYGLSYGLVVGAVV